MLPLVVIIAAAVVLELLSRVPGTGLRLDPWLRTRQIQTLRRMPAREPLDDQVFVARMTERASSEFVVERVRQRVAESATYVARNRIDSSLIYPQDCVVADLGIGAGPDLDDTALIMALEKDLGIRLPDQETERVFTVEELIHLCERHLSGSH